jgi:hypothetical protein
VLLVAPPAPSWTIPELVKVSGAGRGPCYQ